MLDDASILPQGQFHGMDLSTHKAVNLCMTWTFDVLFTCSLDMYTFPPGLGIA